MTPTIKKGAVVLISFEVTDANNDHLDLQCSIAKNTEICFWPTINQKEKLRIFNFPAASVIQTTALERSK